MKNRRKSAVFVASPDLSVDEIVSQACFCAKTAPFPVSDDEKEPAARSTAKSYIASRAPVLMQVAVLLRHCLSI
jgi:hypothetical protein